MRQAYSARNVRYLGHGRAPEAQLDLGVLHPDLNHRWRNVGYTQQEGGVEKWFFDLYTFMDIGLERLGGMSLGSEAGAIDPNSYIGAISTADRSWPRLAISDQRVADRIVEWLGIGDQFTTGVAHFDKRFRLTAEHPGFAQAFLNDEIRSVLLRLPKGCVVEVVGRHVLFLAPADGRLPFALEPILDEFERKVPAIIDTWPGE